MVLAEQVEKFADLLAAVAAAVMLWKLVAECLGAEGTPEALAGVVGIRWLLGHHLHHLVFPGLPRQLLRRLRVALPQALPQSIQHGEGCNGQRRIQAAMPTPTWLLASMLPSTWRARSTTAAGTPASRAASMP